jgi:hypothetical protein
MKKIGEILVEREWLSRDQLHQALKHQQVFGGRLGTCLLELSLVAEERLVKALSDQLNVPPATSDDLRVIQESILELVPAKVACRARVVPFERFGNSVSIALADTRDLHLQDELGFVISKRLKIHVAPEIRILEALEKHYRCQAESRFSRIWDRLNRARFLWQQDEGGSSGGRKAPPPAPSAAEKATPSWQPVHAWGGGPSWDPAPPPPLESGITRLNVAGATVAEQAPPSRPPVVPPPAPPQPAARSAPSPMLPPAPAPNIQRQAPPAPAPRYDAVQPDVTVPVAPADAPQPAARPAAQPAPRQRDHETSPLVVPKAAETLAELRERLEAVEERDDVAHAVLSFLERRFERRVLFMAKGGSMTAWMGSGSGVDQQQLAGLDIPFEQPSAFLNLREGSPFFRGPLPRLDAHQRLVKVWGGKFPREALLLPVRVKDRLVAAVYCDRGNDTLAKVDLGELQEMAAEMGRAFQRYLLQKKNAAK